MTFAEEKNKEHIITHEVLQKSSGVKRAVPSLDTVFDLVNHPPHYKDGGIEVIDFIEAKKFDYNLGNAIKYLSRAGKKNKETEVEDLEKAIWYIKRRIKNIKNDNS